MKYSDPTFTNKLSADSSITLILDYENGFTIAQGKIIRYVKDIIHSLNNYSEDKVKPNITITIGNDDLLTAFSLAVVEDVINENQLTITNINKDFSTKFNNFGRVILSDEERNYFPGNNGNKDTRIIAKILYKQSLKRKTVSLNSLEK